MFGIQNLGTLWLAVGLWLTVWGSLSSPAAAQSASSSRSMYARPGQFAARTTDYRPAWKVHPNVRQPRTASRSTGHPGRQVRYQQEVLNPYPEEDSSPPFEELENEPETIMTPEDDAPPMVIQEPEEEPAPVAAPARVPAERVTPAPAERAPSRAAPRQPTVAPPPPAEFDRPYDYEELPPARAVPRKQPRREFEFEATEEYAVSPEGEEYYEYDDGMMGAPCEQCGQFGEYCECGPPSVCDDTWPCWHARRQWGRFRLFGGGWDVGCPWNWWDELSLFAGPHAFKGPLDQGRNGNFGIQEGINWGGPLWHCHGIGFQLGAQGVQSNFAGYDVNGSVSDDNRNQTFATAGIFSRAPGGHGWQVGVAVDWLQDNYYVDVSLDQVRAELSYVTFCGTEVGGWIASSSTTEEDSNNGMMYEVTDMYAFFFRKCVPTGGEGRIWAGGTGDGNGLVGADFRVPLSNRWEMAGVVNYIIAQDGAGQEGLGEEAWGLTVNLVWHPFRPRHGHPGNAGHYRPLFNVADNTMFMVDREMGQ